MICTLAEEISSVDDFKALCAVLHCKDHYKQLANNLLITYCILKCQADIVSKQHELFNYLKTKNFFKSYEEKLLSERKVDLFNVLTDKSMQSMIELLSHMKNFSITNNLAQKIEREIAVLKSDLESQCSMHRDLALSNSTSVGDFQQYLKQRYKSDNFILNYSRTAALNQKLALIENCDNSHFCFSDYSLLYEQECYGTVLDYSDIFTDNHRVVVLQGPPGSGKTTLAVHLCKQWANGELLQQFSHVIFVQLRDPRVAEAKSLKN